MNQEQLKKMEDFLNQQSHEHHHSKSFENNEIPENADEEIGEYHEGSLAVKSRVQGFDNLLTNFKDQGHMKKCTRATKTKWDTFAPYAFSKLEKQNKVDTFLQLFNDYKSLKVKYNEEMDRNKKMLTKVHFLENQFQKVKTFNTLSPSEKLRAEKEKDHEVVHMKEEIKRLHEKIISLAGNKHSKLHSRPKSSYQKPQKHIVPVNENLKAELDNERKQVRQLLLIIDELKKNKFEVENQLREKQANQSSYRPRKVNNRGPKNTESQFYDYANDLQRWKQKYNDLQLCYNQMNQDKGRQIKELATQLIEVKQNERMKQRTDRRGGHFDISETGKLQQKYRQMVEEKQRLQQELRKLVQMPFYQNNKQIIEVQEKFSKLQLKYSQIQQQLSKSNENSMKYFSQLEFKSKENQMLKTENTKMKKQIKENFERQQGKKVGSTSLNIDYDDYYRKLLALVKLEGDDPVWRKFANMAKPEFHTMTNEQVLGTAETLWNNKLQLLAHLQKAQIQLRTLKEGLDSRVNLYIHDKENMEEQLRVARAKLQQLMSIERLTVKRDYKVFEQAGVKYDDTVSVFDVDELELRELQSNQNYFDLYLGQFNINEAILMKNPQNKIKSINQFISFLTVDFYNHETQHSEFSEGVMKVLGNNYSFKVQVNTYFLKYINKNAVTLQFWSPQGSSTVLLGKGQIRLNQLISKATKDICNIIRGKCSIYSAYSAERSPIATVQFRFRMRLPISPFIEWAETKENFKYDLQKDPFSVSHKKNLSICIERGQGFEKNMNGFVYFSIQNEDFFTEPERGPSPHWDFHRQIQVTVDDEFTDNLKQKFFQFTIFDDEKQVNQDVYGIAKANLTPLVQTTDSLDLSLDVQNDNHEKLGVLKVKVEWI